jgi:pimeloyl-ACP methyl ester carboxylesterase
MNGNSIDNVRFKLKKLPNNWEPNFNLLVTDFGKIRVFDTQENKQVIINVPDGPNVIEHHDKLILELSKNFRVICFEFPGFGFSHPNSKYDYSIEKSAKLILNIMDILKIQKASLSFSCSNGYYAIKATKIAPERFSHLFLAQTTSFQSMENWVKTNIPKILNYPIIGQISNILIESQFVEKGYKYLLPKETDKTEFIKKSLNSLKNGGCNCLSSLVQGLKPDLKLKLLSIEIPTTLIWGTKDFTHRKTNNKSILEHIPNCEIIEFDNCGHYPELENTSEFVNIVNKKLNIK